MTNEFRKKAVELGKLMNSKSKLSVPPPAPVHYQNGTWQTSPA